MLLPPTETEIRRFLSHVEILPSGCWLWCGARSRGSGNRRWYGTFHWRGRSIRAHRFSHDILAGRLCPLGWHRDHTCCMSLCVCPEHIECVTPEENQRRSTLSRRARQAELQRVVEELTR